MKNMAKWKKILGLMMSVIMMFSAGFGTYALCGQTTGGGLESSITDEDENSDTEGENGGNSGGSVDNSGDSSTSDEKQVEGDTTLTDTTSYVSVGEIFNSDDATFDATNLNTLLQYISGDSSVTVSDMSTIDSLAASVQTSADIRENEVLDKTSSQDVQVTFGGLTWEVVYLSQDNDGNAILTLWLSNAQQDAWTSRSSTEGTYYGYIDGALYSDWSADWHDSDSPGSYPSNMYGTSYINAVTLNNGGYYATAGESVTSASQSTSSAFAIFTMTQSQLSGTGLTSVTDYLVTPSNVSWQETENAIDVFGWAYICPNEAYGTPSSGTWYSDTYNYSSKSYYTSWANNYLWLPSLVETGYTSGSEGMWETSTEQRQNYNGSTESLGSSYIVGSGNSSSSYSKTVYTYSWLRSADSEYSYFSYYLESSGASCNSLSVCLSRAVRPSLHLNLDSAALSAAADAGFTLEFNSNINAIDSQYQNQTTSVVVNSGEEFTTTSSSSYNYDGYTLIGWSTTQNVAVVTSLTTATAGAAVTGESETNLACGTTYVCGFSSDVTLYGVWKANSYTITYNSNTTSISTSATTTTVTQLPSYTLSFETKASSTFTYQWYSIVGWSTTQMDVVKEFTADDITSFVGGDGVNLACGTTYTYDLTEDVTLYAVWMKDSLVWEDGYWYFEDGYMPQSYYGSTRPISVDLDEPTGYFEVEVSSRAYATVLVYGDYALVDYYSYSTSGYTCTASGWFNVEPIKWAVAYDADGTNEPTEYTSAVSVQVVMFGYLANSATAGWSTRNSALQTSVNSLASTVDLTIATLTTWNFDIFTSPTTQNVVCNDGSSTYSTLAVASVADIDSIGGEYACVCTDFVAFLASGGETKTGGDCVEYWTRDLAYTADDVANYGGDSYSGAWNNGVYVTEDGTLMNARLSYGKGARLSVSL